MANDDGRVPILPDFWFVPPALADFECEHGKLPGECDVCDGEDDDEHSEHPA